MTVISNGLCSLNWEQIFQKRVVIFKQYSSFIVPLGTYLFDYVKRSLRRFEYLFVYLILIGLEIKLLYYEVNVVAIVYSKVRLEKK